MKLRISLLALLCVAAAPPGQLSLHVGGRVIAEADGTLAFGWPGIYFESRFRGTGFRLRFEAPAEHMRLLVDDREIALYRRPGKVDATFAGLDQGDHVVRLEKLTESQSGGGRFLGFFAIAGDAPLPPPRRIRQIEFIGDSFTVGYGNTSTARECSAEQVHDTTDAQQAFGPLVARHFDADYRVIAYSGFGIVRNYAGGSSDLSLPAIYWRPKPDDAGQVEREAGEWRPQLIVMNLGTNDFSTPLKAGERWRDRAALEADYRRRYVEFVREIGARQPQARFILMGSEDFLPQVEQVAAALAGEMPGRATALAFGGLDHQGCHFHPSLADDRKLAALIGERIEALHAW